MAERSKNMVEAERVDRADIVERLITWLNVMPKSRLDLIHPRIGVGHAGDRTWTASDLVEHTEELRDNDAGLSAAGASGQHHILFAASCTALLRRQSHGSASHWTASEMYFGMPEILSTCREAICAKRAFPKRLAVERTESLSGSRISFRWSVVRSVFSSAYNPARSFFATIGAPMSSAAQANILRVEERVNARSNVVAHAK